MAGAGGDTTVTTVFAISAVAIPIGKATDPDPDPEEETDAAKSAHALVNGPYIDAFMDRKSALVELEIGKEKQVFLKTTFLTDKPGSILRLYVDYDLSSTLPTLFHYVVLSAHFNKTTKSLVCGSATYQHTSGAKHVVLCILRTKCISPVYKVVVLDVARDEVFMLGHSQFKKCYSFLPNEPVKKDLLVARMYEFFEKTGLVWDKHRPNKDDSGSPITDERAHACTSRPWRA